MALPSHLEDIYPLSPLQQGMLFHASLDPQSGDYVVQLSAQLASWVDPQQLRRALDIMTERHQILRTAFLPEAPERPLQIVFRNGRIPWSELDWSAISNGSFQERLDKFLETDRRREFVLTEAPLFRIAIIALEGRRNWITLSFHHILWDGWSLKQILQELNWCCEAVAEGRVPVKVDRRPFRDYIEWLQRQNKAAAEAFWRDELAGFSGSRLGLKHSRTNSKEPAFARLKRGFTAEEHAALTNFARAHKLTLNTLVQGAWAILVGRYSDRDDIVFGATVSGRPATLPGADMMLGMFLNTIPVRVRLSGNAPLEEWLTDLQRRQLRAREFDFCQLAEIQRMVAGTGASALFESIVDFKSFRSGETSGDSEKSIFAGDIQSYEQTGYPLTLTVSLAPELFFEADFDLTHYDVPSIGRMLGHLHTLLLSMPRCTGRPVVAISLLTPAELQKIESWSSGPQERSRRTVFQQDFERIVAHSPQAIAVLCDDANYTYATLNRMANRLAAYLKTLDIGPERCVGVCLERSIHLIVACIAVRKLGAVYVPLDPAYPRERLRQYIDATDLGAMIVTASTAAAAPETTAVTVKLDQDDELIASCSDSNPGVGAISNNNLAYILHTSGSTGLPKGAMVEVAGLLNHLDLLIGFLDLGPSDVVAQTASICFDISVWQILAPLLVGAAVSIVGADTVLDMSALKERLHRDRITVLQIVPTLLRLLLEEEETARPIGPTLRWIVTTGETISPDLAGRWMKLYSDIPLVNAYGPAECSDDVSLTILRPEKLKTSLHVPIGRPVQNTELYVLDRQLNMAPAGVIGELYVGGVCVGRGYKRDPRATAKAFIPHPFAERPGERLYRTGDLARWRDDGELEFLGRRDHQLKIHGARIEAGDIEAALLKHDLVEQAIVDCVGEGSHRALVAYIVLAPRLEIPLPEALTIQLRAHLYGRLPRHMVPSVFTILDAMPLNLNGKLDRDRLVSETPPVPAIAKQHHPHTPPEEVVAGIWSLLLKREYVAPDDDFFALGGHSLLAMQMIARAARVLGCAVPLRTIFESPTLREFTRAVLMQRKDTHLTVPLVVVPRGRPLPVSAAEVALWRLIVSHPHTALSNIPMVFRLSGSLNEEALEAALGDIMERHEPLRTRIRVHEEKLAQYIDPFQPFHLQVADLTEHPLAEAEQIARRLASQEAHWPFNPVLDLAMRALLLRLGPCDYVLFLTLNHLLSDDASCGLLLADLHQAYHDRAAGQTPSLQFLPIQFADYVCWLEAWLSGPECRRQQDFWRRYLCAPMPRLDLPVSRPRTESLSFRFRRTRRQVSSDVYQRLQDLARTSCTTLFTVILAAFKLFLAGQTGQRDIRLGTLMTVRNRPELQPLVAPLVTTLILRTDLSGNPRFSDIMTRVQRSLIDVLSNCELPIEQVVAAAMPDRDLRRDPPFQALVIFQQPIEEQWSLGDIQVTSMALEEPEGDELEITSHELICEIEARLTKLDIVFRYNADLFDESLIYSFLSDFIALLAESAASPRRTIDALLAAIPLGA